MDVLPNTTEYFRIVDAKELTIASETRGSAHLLKLSGDLDMATVRPFEEELKRVEARGPYAIVVDLAALDFLDSHGATALANGHRRARRDGRDFSVLQGAPHIHASFELLGLDERLPFG
jgi:anti-anti-sigma factor